MTSPSQVLANMKNALSSTGPRSPEGKTTSSQNAITHALTGGFRVLPQEDQTAYDAQVVSYMTEFKPRGEHMTFLVEMMVQARWEIKRTNRLEAAVVARMCKDADAQAASADAVIADALIAKTADALQTLKRYATAAERRYMRCNRELVQARNREAKEAAAQADVSLKNPVQPPKAQQSALTSPVRNEPKIEAASDATDRKLTVSVPFTGENPLTRCP